MSKKGKGKGDLNQKGKGPALDRETTGGSRGEKRGGTGEGGSGTRRTKRVRPGTPESSSGAGAACEDTQAGRGRETVGSPPAAEDLDSQPSTTEEASQSPSAVAEDIQAAIARLEEITVVDGRCPMCSADFGGSNAKLAKHLQQHPLWTSRSASRRSAYPRRSSHAPSATTVS